MILQNKINDVQIEGENLESSGKMHINVEESGHIIRMLTRAYADRIGSIVRESVANAKDSHTMAGVTSPIIVRIKPESNGEYTFEVEDRGLGLDDKEFFKYIMGIGESTKRLIANVIGGYGLGSKAASSYSENYFYTCRKNGVERKYMIYQDEDIPNSTLLYEKATEEGVGNGVIVSVPIKPGDVKEFKNKVSEQLAYFSGVYFEGCEIDNDYKIYRTSLFQYSEICTDSNMHISLDDVYYPIDFNKLGIKLIDISIALRFSLLDGISVIPNRENVEYTKETKRILIKRIEEVAIHLFEQYNKNVQNFDNIEDVFNFYEEGEKWKYEIFPRHEINIKSLSPYSALKLEEPKLKGIEKLDLHTIYNKRRDIFNCYSITETISNGKKRSGRMYEYRKPTIYAAIGNKDNKVILYTTPIEGKKRTYIKEEYRNCNFVKKSKEWQLKSKDVSISLKDILLTTYDKKDWRQVINEWLSIVKYFEEKLLKEEDIIVPKAWLDARKKKKVVGKRLEGQVNFKFARLRYNSSNEYTFDGKLLDLLDASLQKSIVVYSTEEDSAKLKWLARVNTNDNIKIAIVGKQDFKRLNELGHHKFKNLTKIMEEYNKLIGNFASSYKAHKLLHQYSKVFELKDSLKEISKIFSDNLTKIEEFTEKFPLEVDSPLTEAVITLCEANKWKNWEMDAVINEVEKNIAKIDFLGFFKNSGHWSVGLKEGSIPIIKELLISRKFRMDWENYVIKEEVVEPILKEEVIDL